MFGVPIADLTLDETISLIEELVANGRRNGRTHQISTVNVDFLVNALDDDALAAILQQADVCIPDGMPVVWGSRILGMPIRQRVAGADLVPLLIGESERTGWHVHVFGSTPEVATTADALLRERHPAARFTIDPGPIIADVELVDPSVLERIAAVDADILCVALGNPKQERFIAMHRDALKVPVMIGVGGSLDMLVGKRRRAPAWMQSLGLEWIVRALQEPRRLGGRYVHDIRVFFPAIFSAWIASRRRRSGVGLGVRSNHGGRLELALEGSDTLPLGQWSSLAEAMPRTKLLTVVASADRPASDRSLAQLVGLIRIAARSGTRVDWALPEGRPPEWVATCGVSPAAVVSSGS
jgi:N-acetylglucosaminyldiphosphoundecaprenol N-acetyl-beta-D-mannosaminyltransferase